MESSCTTTLQWNYCENKTIWQAWPHLDWEFKLVVHFRHQKVMAESFPHLHDSDNGSIDLVLTVLEYSLCSAGLLLHLRGTAEKHETKWPITFRQQQSHDRCAGQYRFFHLDLVDFNPEKFVFEIIITKNFVSILHFFTLWDFGKNTGLPTGQRLQSPPQLTVLCKWMCILNAVKFLNTWKLSNILFWKDIIVSIPMPVASLISSRENSSPSLNISRTNVWNRETCNSFLPCEKKGEGVSLNPVIFLRSL